MNDVTHTIQCNACRESLPIDVFNFRNKAKGVRQPKCRECTKVYIREHYIKNKDQYLERNRRGRKRNRQKLLDLKKSPCTDCGHSFPSYVMEFDHRDPATKSFSIGRSNPAWHRRVLIEVEKCDLVCANCHKIRTYTRRYGTSA